MTCDSSSIPVYFVGSSDWNSFMLFRSGFDWSYSYLYFLTDTPNAFVDFHVRLPVALTSNSMNYVADQSSLITQIQ